MTSEIPYFPIADQELLTAQPERNRLIVTISETSPDHSWFLQIMDSSRVELWTTGMRSQDHISIGGVSEIDRLLASTSTVRMRHINANVKTRSNSGKGQEVQETPIDCRRRGYYVVDTP
ncbi:hypothetical protein T310_6438 [Rasamsonia emersonii CBS 393.64]|uniref:Uncharacterized protein n=1 Tax=Rasamsonia emersonii (strain ATCC 16479 / CBS 393.64 / IMI 116815) TaxID=1408163 RepID=A0A0F4YNZ6_RASE3|nr:hypothetical protein T310_6438 [Rasamsonia emersonii CBS 393.64]KKA19581.1 hypothetical protein T310_6438 [Rasamsonia emersonii CBS 393.64]